METWTSLQARGTARPSAATPTNSLFIQLIQKVFGVKPVLLIPVKSFEWRKGNGPVQSIWAFIRRLSDTDTAVRG